MKAIKLALLLALSPAILYAQGVNFEKAKNWNEVLLTAKAEHKLIFVDCYATWCGPCKLMDREIYPNDTVGSYMNARFISVKVQMDKTPIDDPQTKGWYNDAAMLAKDYTINAFPTFLFFSPDGNPLHKAVGAKLPATAFLRIAEDAQNTDRQYYSILNNFLPGKLDTGELKGLALSVGYDRALSAKIALDYLHRCSDENFYHADNISFAARYKDNLGVQELIANKVMRYIPDDFTEKNHENLVVIFKEDPAVQSSIARYIKKLSGKQMVQKNNLEMLSRMSLIMQVHDRYFDLFYLHPKEMDKILGRKGLSEHVTDPVIIRQLISPKTQKADSLKQDADWPEISRSIAALTDTASARRTIASARFKFYTQELADAEVNNALTKFFWGGKLATALCAHLTVKIIAGFPQHSELAAGYLNNNAFTVFEYSADSSELKQALTWINKAMEMTNKDSYSLDTKANILYKLGKIDQALPLERQAVAANPNPRDGEFAKALRQMEANQPTWPLPAK